MHYGSMKNLLTTLFLISLILLTGLKGSDAVTKGWVPPDDYRSEDSFEIVLEPSLANEEETETTNKEMSMEDIFGSEQVFPFPPGLGN
tara:strand:- start:131 stop:394 length:264 start_codon:yes stop_codon:yes gene_type:complete